MANGDNSMALKHMVLFVVVCLSLIISDGTEGRRISREETIELMKQLKILNKPPVSTIQTEEGDILDCIDIYKQPALDHPLLKNHKIQMRPSFFPKVVTNTSSQTKVSHIRFGSNGCPSGTVPIRRTQKKDLVRAKSLRKPFASHPGQLSPNPSNLHLVQLRFAKISKGGKAYMVTYNPMVVGEQSSSASMWIEGGTTVERNYIQAGWTADDNKKTGCFNTLCSGFVQVDKTITPSSIISQTTIIGSESQFGIRVNIHQDHQTGNWWFIVTDKNISVGYWPKSIFTHLTDGCEVVAFGGMAKSGTNGISPPMGSGELPNGDYKRQCAITNIEVTLKDDTTYPVLGNEISTSIDKSGCYDLKLYDYDYEILGSSLLFGGPGGKCA